MKQLTKILTLLLFSGFIYVNINAQDDPPTIPNNKSLAEKSDGSFCCAENEGGTCTQSPDC